MRMKLLVEVHLHRRMSVVENCPQCEQVVNRSSTEEVMVPVLCCAVAVAVALAVAVAVPVALAVAVVEAVAVAHVCPAHGSWR